jgi:hypothetical protein
MKRIVFNAIKVSVGVVTATILATIFMVAIGIEQSATTPSVAAAQSCEATPTPVPCTTAIPTSTFPPTITAQPSPSPSPSPSLSPSPSPFPSVSPPPSSINLVENPWFADAECKNSKAGWTDQSNPAWGTGVPKAANPGPCDTAIRWYYSSHPALVWGVIEQEIDLPPQTALLRLQYWYVSLSTGLGMVNIYDQSGNLLHQSSWSGHLITWQQSEWEEFDVPVGTTRLTIQLNGWFEFAGGVKISGVELQNITPFSLLALPFPPMLSIEGQGK